MKDIKNLALFAALTLSSVSAFSAPKIVSVEGAYTQMTFYAADFTALTGITNPSYWNSQGFSTGKHECGMRIDYTFRDDHGDIIDSDFFSRARVKITMNNIWTPYFKPKKNQKLFHVNLSTSDSSFNEKNAKFPLKSNKISNRYYIPGEGYVYQTQNWETFSLSEKNVNSTVNEFSISVCDIKEDQNLQIGAIEVTFYNQN